MKGIVVAIHGVHSELRFYPHSSNLNEEPTYMYVCMYVDPIGSRQATSNSVMYLWRASQSNHPLPTPEASYASPVPIVASYT